MKVLPAFLLAALCSAPLLLLQAPPPSGITGLPYRAWMLSVQCALAAGLFMAALRRWERSPRGGILVSWRGPDREPPSHFLSGLGLLFFLQIFEAWLIQPFTSWFLPLRHLIPAAFALLVAGLLVYLGTRILTVLHRIRQRSTSARLITTTLWCAFLIFAPTRLGRSLLHAIATPSHEGRIHGHLYPGLQETMQGAALAWSIPLATAILVLLTGLRIQRLAEKRAWILSLRPLLHPLVLFLTAAGLFASGYSYCRWTTGTGPWSHALTFAVYHWFAFALALALLDWVLNRIWPPALDD